MERPKCGYQSSGGKMPNVVMSVLCGLPGNQATNS